MPDYCFFLSYASNDRIKADRESESTNKQDLVRIFYNDLNATMTGLGYGDGGFFDKKRLEAKWKPELQEGLASSRILVPLYSRNYFQSAYCGKEWETFHQRFDENHAHRYADVSLEQVILPIFWKSPVVFPAAVSQYQIHCEDYPADYEKNGLEYLMSFKRQSAAYRQFVWTFSRKLLTLADGQGAPKVRDVVDFDTLNPPFPGNNRPGLKFVRYVFVAGLKHEMSTVRSTTDCYANYVDRRDWRPCFPDLDRAIEGIATGPAKAESRGYELLAPSGNLMTQLREARRLNNVIIILVDPWSLKLSELKKFLDDFDAEEFPNSAVLVNWNPNDPETSAQSAHLQSVIQDYFKGRRGRKEYHKDPVSSPESIEQAVVEAFGAVQARLIELGKIRPAGDGDPGPAPVIRN